MNCGPRYKDQNGIKNKKRGQGYPQCDKYCPYYKDCIEELSGGNDHILELKSERQIIGFQYGKMAREHNKRFVKEF